MTANLEIARHFGEALDRDDFAIAGAFLSAQCAYHLSADEVLVGPEAICGSYEKCMREGRAKLDELRWGACTVEAVGAAEVDVRFTDYLVHQGVEHIHRCKQRVTIGDDGLIVSIVHMDLPGERETLNAFYERVGLAGSSSA